MDNCLGNCEWCRDTRSATENKQLWSLTLCQSIFAFYFILQWHMKWKIIKFNEKILHATFNIAMPIGFHSILAFDSRETQCQFNAD